VKKLIESDLNMNEKAVSQNQQQAAGIALSVKRGESPKSVLQGASKEMYKMSEKELEKLASTKHKKLPNKKMTELQEKIARLVELMSKKYLRETKPAKNSNNTPIYEYGRTIATEVLRDLVDDYQLHIEMLIDDSYGTLDVNQFKKQWYKISSDFERKFSNTLKNMVGKQ